MGQPIVHFEIAGKDGEKLEQFYAALFGWRIQRKEAGGTPYGAIPEGEAGPLGGGVRHEPEGSAEVVLYVRVPDLKASVAKAQSMGASVRIPPLETPDVTFALLSDPEGNPVGLVQD